MKTEINFNKEAYNQSIESVEQGANNLNELINLVEKFTNKKATEKQVFEIKENPKNVLDQFVDNTIPESFRNSNIDFKLDALGLKAKYYNVIEYYQDNLGSWVAYEYEVKASQFIVSEKYKNIVRQSHTIYVETEEQKAKFDYLTEIAKMLNKGVAKDYITAYNRPAIQRAIRGLNLDVPQGKTEFEFVVNPYICIE